MGLVNPGVPKALALHLQQKYNLDTFVETGTYYGGTAVWAASNFKQVYTIEFAKQIYDQVVKLHGGLKNIQFVFGDSRQQLQTIVPTLDQPALFWLDGHWSVGETYGENDECPILGELEAILQSQHENYILIDDARLFLAPPPDPLHIEQWPTIKEIADVLSAGENPHQVFVYEDAIIAVPQAAAHETAQYLQGVITAQWSNYLSPTRRGYGLMREGWHWVYLGLRTKVRRLVPDPIVRGAKSLLGSAS